MLPSIWRDELYHPMVVHLPIGLLLLGAFYGVIQELRQAAAGFSSSAAADRRVVLALLIPGCLTAWLAIWTGDWAEKIANRRICDPTVTAQHQDLAWISAYLFTAAAALLLLRQLAPKLVLRRGYSALLSVGVLLLLCGGSIYLTWAAHLGATLTYQQGAGVYHPTEQCSEFE